MKWVEFDDGGSRDGGVRTLVMIGEPGDDALSALSDLVREQGITAGQFTAIGAFSRAVVGWFDRSTKDYRRIPVEAQCEVLSLVGDVALADGGPQVHAHVVLGLADGSVRGGHLLEGDVWPTLEVVLREVPGELRKTSRRDLGLALIDIGRSAAR